MVISEKKKASNQRWDDANLKRFTVSIPIQLYEELMKRVAGKSISRNRYIRDAIIHEMSADDAQSANDAAIGSSSGEPSEAR